VAYLSIKQLTDPTDPLSDPDLESVPLFPNFSGPNQSRVLLPSPLDTSFILPPNFVQPGETGVIDLEFVIFRPTSNLIFERATRRFRMPVKVLNPFDGFIRTILPPGTSSAQLSPDFDFDGDGVSNFNEWVFGSDPSQAGSVPKSPGVQLVTAAPATGGPSGPQLMQTAADTGSQAGMEYKVTKLTNPVPKLKYSIEYSPDMVTWTEIKSDNPSWNLVETRTEIKVSESGTSPKSGGFFRTKVQTAN
jgi:hypothetical protein